MSFIFKRKIDNKLFLEKEEQKKNVIINEIKKISLFCSNIFYSKFFFNLKIHKQKIFKFCIVHVIIEDKKKEVK